MILLTTSLAWIVFVMGAFQRDYDLKHVLVTLLKSSFYSGPLIDNKRELESKGGMNST